MDPLAERFRRERERLGISIRELALETKIREPYIDALERGRYDVLPAVYVRSFIRTIGITLQIPAEEIQSLMNSTFDEDSDSSSRLPAYKPQQQQREPTISFSNAAQRTTEAVAASMDKVKSVAQSPLHQAQQATRKISPLAGALILTVLIGLGLWWFAFRDNEPGAGIAGPEVVDVTSSADNGIADTDSLILTAIASDTAWISITMDGARNQQSVLLPEGEYRWSAMEKFIVSLGNAGAIQFFRNGRPLPAFGRVGEAVREIRITRKDITASNTTFKAPNVPAPKQSTPRPVVQPVAKPVASPTTKPAAKPVVKPVVKSTTKPAVKTVTKARQRAPAARKIERPLITPAPPQPIRR
ncbi:MAG TPA: RodZ domain-containing protein [Candidatus Didemnitutus sp.]|nr:RodZ domain-containing protein [Candidatus Didemnitutus sp.]